MEEKKITLIDNERAKLQKLFLHTIFIKPEFIKGEISKHLEIPLEHIALKENKSDSDENGEVTRSYYTLSMFDSEFVLRYDKKVEQPKEINVPKVVNKPKKWWQRESEQMVVVEQKLSSAKPITHWVLSAIN